MISSGKILFICGSLNQTSMMHEISRQLTGYEHYFTPYYADGLVRFLAEAGLLNFTILGGKFRADTEAYLREQGLTIDYRGEGNEYDLVFTCVDLIIPGNIRHKKLILVQEGMTDPENLIYYMVKWLKLPRFLASTSATGLSDSYDYFCVASEGYRNLFIAKGVKPEKVVVTGIPNFDNTQQYLTNDFPHKNHVLVATSDMRETFHYENRAKFIKHACRIADGRKLIFKLHPNENFKRAEKEINKYAPGALVYFSGNTNHMVANCDTFITRYSSVVYVALALNKEIYCDINAERLKELMPLQNGGASAGNIAAVAALVLKEKDKKVLELMRAEILQSLRLKPYQMDE